MINNNEVDWFEELYAKEKRKIIDLYKKYNTNHPSYYATAIEFLLEIHENGDL
jgi:hypothetical protein